MGTERIQIGNVGFYQNDVQSAKVKYKNGEKINCVFLKNGTKLEFPDQNKDAKAKVGTGYENNRYGTGFFGITGLSIEGTKGDDYYHLTKCDNYNVNVENGGNDEVRIHDKEYKVNGTINADVNDEVSFSKNYKYFNMNEGFFIRRD